MKINIFKRGIKNVYSPTNIRGIAALSFIALVWLLKSFFMGIVLLILCVLGFSPYLSYLFGDSKVVFNSPSFVLNNKLFFKNKKLKGNTGKIQDISLNYQALKEPKNFFNFNDHSAILVTTQEFGTHSSYQQYAFGKGLS